MGNTKIPPNAMDEVARCCRDGLTAHKARLRLLLVGVGAADRTVTRWMASWREEQKRGRQAEAAEQSRLREMEAVGRGLASVQLGSSGLVDLLKVYAPGYRQRQAGALIELVRQFLERPTPELLCNISVGLHSYFLSSALSEAVEDPPHA
jgi:hypothetical protein